MATYHPFSNFIGTDSFTFAAWNGEKDSNLGTVAITVNPGACVLMCESVVPSNSVSRTELPFWAFASVDNCTDPVLYRWTFGDGGASTNALDPASKLAFTAFEYGVVRWASEPNRVYQLNSTTSLTAQVFAPLVTDIPSTPPENSYTGLTTTAAARFYQLELE